MKRLDQAKQLLKELQVPSQQQSDLCAHVLLALANLRKSTPWAQATNKWLRIHDVIQFIKEAYGIAYAENSRETLRKQAMHNFRNAAFIEDNGVATNSPNYRYRLTDEMLELLRTYRSSEWQQQRDAFLAAHESLISQYSSKRVLRKMSVKINKEMLSLSTGSHNALQKAILEEFAPRFAPNSECLYVGDTTEKDLVKNEQKLEQLGFDISVHDTMPDVVLYSEDRNWLFFIEAVTSVGPMSPKRILEIDRMTQNVTAGKIYITAFRDKKTYKQFIADLAWETEVWIAEAPDHMIHLNGDKFLGPR